MLVFLFFKNQLLFSTNKISYSSFINLSFFMSFLSNLNWRYAAKSFDPTKKVSSEDLSKVLEAIRMTPTSFGLQPYHFYVIENQDIKDRIQGAAWGQLQISTSSHLIVLCARTDLRTNQEEYFHGMSGGSPEVRAKLKGFEDMLHGFIHSTLENGGALNWAAKQTYIALGFAHAALAELEIDSCPMEGFDPSQVAEILSLPQHLTPTLLLPMGYRAQGEIPRPKFRFSQDQLFTSIK